MSRMPQPWPGETDVLPPGHVSPYAPLTSILASDRWILRVIQQPEVGKLSGQKEKDRKPLDPPPVIQLDSAIIDPRNPDSDLYLQTSLRDAPGEETKETPKKATRDALCGTTVSTAHRYRSENHEKCIFVFSDLSSRKEGYFQLLFELYFLDTVANEAVFLKEILSDTFRVYPMKTYPGVRSSTSLTRHMGEQGIRLRVRKDTKLYGAARGKKPLSADGSAQRTRLPSSQLLSLPRSMSTSSEGAMYQPPPPSSLLSSQLPLSSWDQDIQERPTQRRRTDSASVLAISSTSAEAEEAGQLTFRGPGYMDQDGREADPHEGSSALGPQPYYQSNLATHPPTDHIYQFQGQQPGPYDPIYPVYGFDPSGHGMVEPSMELAEPTPEYHHFPQADLNYTHPYYPISYSPAEAPNPADPGQGYLEGRHQGAPEAPDEETNETT